MLFLINGRKQRRCRSVGWKNRLLDWFVEDVKDGRLSVAVVGKKTTQNLMPFGHPVTIFVVSSRAFRRSKSTLGWEQFGESQLGGEAKDTEARISLLKKRKFWSAWCVCVCVCLVGG